MYPCPSVPNQSIFMDGKIVSKHTQTHTNLMGGLLKAKQERDRVQTNDMLNL